MPRMVKGQPPRLTPQQINGVIRALDIWALLENPAGNRHLSGNLFYDEEAMGRARQIKFVLLESQREKTLPMRTAYAETNGTARVLRRDRKRSIHLKTSFTTPWCVADSPSTKWLNGRAEKVAAMEKQGFNILKRVFRV